jgi:hypothetical protein
MKIIIRKLEDRKHTYFAYLRGLCGKATYLLYFEDNITGAVSLHNFIEMLQTHFKIARAEVHIQDREIAIKSAALLEAIGLGANYDHRDRSPEDLNEV